MMMQGKPSEGKVFDLDIAEYVAASQIEEYLSQEFKDRYEYPLRSFVFHQFVGVRIEKINILFGCHNFLTFISFY